MTTEPLSPLDKVIYLASLVSNTRAIDKQLDVVRLITADLQSGRQLSPSDIEALEQVSQKLREHLINHDPLRTFTPESLEQNVRNHFTSTGHGKAQKTLWLVLGVALLAYTLPLAILSSLKIDVRGQVSAALVLNTFHIGTAWFFLAALKDFKPELKKAYTYICTGTIIVGLSQIQLPVVALLKLSDSPWFHYGGLMAPFAIATFLMYIGLRLYASAVAVQSKANSWPLVVSSSLAATVLLILLPRIGQPDSELFFSFSTISLALNGIGAGLGATLAYRISQNVSETYSKATRMLFWTLLAAAFGSVGYLSSLYISGELTGTSQLMAAIPFIISEILMLSSGYIFYKNTRR